MESIENLVEKLPRNIKKNLDQNLCVCNDVPKIKIINAIVNGAETVDDVKRQTYATMGTACCKQQVEKLIEFLSLPETKKALSLE